MKVVRIPAALAMAASLAAAPFPARAEEPAAAPAAEAPARRLIGLRAEAGISSGFGSQVVVDIPTSEQGNPQADKRETRRELSADSRGNVRIGYDFPVGISLLLHFAYASLSASTTPGENARAEKAGSGSVTLLGLEGRYYLMRARTVPFVFAELNKTFVAVGETSGGDAVQEPAHNLVADATDTFGVAFGVGAEHAFARQFSVGAKWGLELTFTGYDDRDTKIVGTSTSVGTAAELYAAFKF